MSTKTKNKIRLYVDGNLISGQSLVLNEEQSHYLCNVLRQPVGAVLSCFDNKNGEFDCVLLNAHKKQSQISVGFKTKSFQASPDIHLLFAPVKKDKTDFIIEKSTELGVRKIIPVITEYTIVEKVRSERYLAQAIEASEQCRRVDLPYISEAQNLKSLLADWDANRLLFFMDETGRGQSAQTVFSSVANLPAAILVGPEGGFSENELELLHKLPYTKSVSLGSRILRAETAVVSALSIWQALAGDWR